MNEQPNSTKKQETGSPQGPILLVENNVEHAELLSGLLKQQGYRVTIARDGAEGLAAARKEQPRLIISDTDMPVMDGYEMCYAIRQAAELKDTPVILLTMLSNTREVFHGLNAGADYYVAKPLIKQYLLPRIESVLREPPGYSEKEIEMELSVDGEKYRVKAGHRQIMNQLISIYENAVLQNHELASAQDQSNALHEHLVQKTQELEQANARLQELDQLKSMFIASMSHELRTPLNSIIGFTGVILQGIAGPISEEQRKQLTIVKESAAHLLQLINDVIDVSKMESGKAEVVIAEFDLCKLVQEVAESFAVMVQKKGIELAVDVPERLPVVSDQRRVRQILVNLLGNAVKFTDSGRIALRLSAGAEGVEIEVRDTGCAASAKPMKR